MPTPKQIKTLRHKIQHSIFLKEELKKGLLEKLENVKPADFALLTSLFNDAEKKQDLLLTKIVKYDDTFVTRLKHFIKNEIRKFHGGVEKAQRKKEKAEEILKEIE